MKLLIVLSAILLVGQCINIEEQWHNYKSQHQKLYKNLLEDKVRFSIFKDNVQAIEEHNKKFDQGLVSWKMGVNQFTDMTKTEFVDMLKISGNKPEIVGGVNKILLEERQTVQGVDIDWRTKGAVTDVKNQGKCGSCWSFSTTGALEGAYFVKKGSLLSFSEQCLVDCSTENAGCDGGTMNKAFNFIYQHGITTEDEYPYTGEEGSCQYTDSEAVTTISQLAVIPQDSESTLAYAVKSYGPVSVSIDATNFQSYDSGVFDDPECSSTKLNHGVLAVGYGNQGSDYWIVKNSWGDTWGERGYVKMSRNKNNQCGIATAASVPIV